MGITPEAYERVVLNALIRNPATWQDCDRASLDIAVADCIQAGLAAGREAMRHRAVQAQERAGGAGNRDPDDRGAVDAGKAGNAGAGLAGEGGVSG